MDLMVVRGLNNLGNSCFMNSALQCLTHIKPLARLILSEGSAGAHDEYLYNVFKEHLKTYYGGNDGAFSPKQLFSSMKNINSRMTPGRQHDAHEYALGVLDVVEEHFKKIKRGKDFENVFGGRLVSEVTCNNCKHVSSSHEHMESLSLVLSDN
jgi:ubiquitin carboxyl-terminal hydrolase 36/42